MTILSIDAGTSTIKAAAFDRMGRELFVVRRDSVVERPREGWSEQDMALVWDTVCDAVRETAGNVDDIDAIAITAQGDGCWLIDAAGAPVGPALLWNDARAADQVGAWVADGAMAHGYAVSGSVTFPGLANALLRWIADNQPARLHNSAYALTCGSWIFYQATGDIRAEPSDASAPFMDARTADYSDDLLSSYGLSACKRLLAPIKTGAARLTADAARRTGLREGLPVVLAPYDVPAAALGVGAHEAGDAVAVLGTTFLCGVVTDRPVIGDEPSGCLVSLGLPSRFLRFQPTLAGMEVVHWAAHLLGLADARDVITLATEAPPGANGAVFLPYLSPAGERAPFLDPSARGSFWNLSLAHSRADMARAVLEGLCMVVRDCLTAIGVQPSELRLSGGGTTSPSLCQMLVDVTGTPAQRAASSELTCRGAALYALLVHGRASALPEWQASARESWSPKPQQVKFYAQQFVEFRRVREIARANWRAAGTNLGRQS
ncbi:MAG: carbohydrate kinase [Proteobacteria bacterium]|nr:carbohydrate kinase [Pseudomonadota bacterium]